MVPMLSSEISQNFMQDYYENEAFSSFGSSDAVIIVNPTKYMIDPLELQASEEFIQSYMENPYEIQ